LNEVLSAPDSEPFASILITHAHDDHIGGVQPLLDELKRKFPSEPLPKVYKWNPDTKAKTYTYHGILMENIEDGQLFEADGVKLKAMRAPGHTCDHMFFIVEVRKC